MGLFCKEHDRLECGTCGHERGGFFIAGETVGGRYNMEQAQPSQIRLAVYLGKYMTSIVPGEKSGIFVRGIPRMIDDKSSTARKIKAELFPDFQIINEKTYYIGASNTLDDFDMIKECFADSPFPKLLIMRDMGIGDVIMSMPTIAEIKRRLPHLHITYATQKPNFSILKFQDFIDDIVDLNNCDITSGKYDLIINWCRCLEQYKIERNRGQRVLSFAKMLGIGDLDEKVVVPFLDIPDYCGANSILGEIEGPYITYVLKAATWNRSYPIEKAADVFKELRKRFPKHKILVLDNQQSFDLFEGIEGVYDLSGKTENIMQAAAICYYSDLVITPDTGLAHMAAAMSVPTLVLLSSMPFEWRYDHYGPHIDYILKENAAECVPCWDWQRFDIETNNSSVYILYPDHRNHRTSDTYCNKSKENHCLMKIKPKEIAVKALGLWNINNGK